MHRYFKHAYTTYLKKVYEISLEADTYIHKNIIKNLCMYILKTD